MYVDLSRYTVKPVMRGHLKKCPYMTGVPSSQVHFNVKVYFVGPGRIANLTFDSL